MAAFATGVLNRPSKSKLEEAFLGRNLKDVLSPAAVIDRAILQRNCDQMLDACRSLQVEFRPHVKTHKVNSTALFTSHLQASRIWYDWKLLHCTIGVSFSFHLLR